MTTIINQSLTLDEFLKLPETKPVREYINGEIITKPMPKGKHSRLQLRLCNSINDITEAEKSLILFLNCVVVLVCVQ